MIRERRLAKKMTLSELSKASGVSRVSINRYELGQRVPNIENARKIARALGCSLDELATNERAISTPRGECVSDHQENHHSEERQQSLPRCHSGKLNDTTLILLHPTEESSKEESQKRVQEILGSKNNC